ncbi:T9SS type A sorting domain-containing protein [Emticicia sp. BO119]|uniref:T9SS type A sorting domain-containing protein n=1 Tax=Emticicia sp. BO119 TaxID=2757768 RepID=UPI0015F117CF|nr:T9SS type A sorting domain-containing protein [Emticicia sp. BO119]MBA4848883.1 T9SS type A sorting domain-containing protein [Emticicia sp. BO119]
MRKNYFLSLLLLMSAFWNVEAKEREISKETAPTSTAMVAPLPKPTGLDGQSIGGVGTQINLFWNDNSSGVSQETGFQIAVSSDGGATYSVNNAGPNLSAIASGTLPGLTPGTTYKIAVRAVKTSAGPTTFSGCTVSITGPTDNIADLYSCWSDIVTISTNPTVPTAPSNVVILDNETTQTTAKLYFNDNSTNEQGFYISRSTNGGPWVPVVTLPAMPGTGQRTYIDNTLPDASYHVYQIAAYNVSGLSTVVASRQFETLPYRPQAPSELISPWTTLNKIRLEWTINSTNQTAFVIQRSSDGNGWYDLTDSWFPYINFFEDENVSEGQTFYYRVLAVNKGGRSEPSNVLKASTKKRVPPPAPYDLAAKTISPYRIDLNWSNQIFGEYDVPLSTEIYRSSVSATDGFVQIAILSPEQYTYSDTTGKPKTKYWYKLLSANTFGQSAYSNIASATTLGPPSTPTDLQVVSTKDSLGNDILVVHWTDASDDEDYFVLDRATDVNFTQNLLTANLLKNYTSATSIPFDEGVTYFFRIRAVNVHGSSPYTDWTSVTSFYTAVPNKPYALKATATTSAVTLTWGDDSNKEAGFEIERSTDGTNWGKVTTTAMNVISYVDNTVAANTKYWYRVRAVNPKGSSDYSNVVVVSTPAAANGLVGGADHITNDAWVVYPNPTADAVRVTLPESMQNQAGVVTIIDRMNREVIKSKLNSNQTEYRFDLSNFSEGTYTISIRTGSQQISKRVYKY